MSAYFIKCRLYHRQLYCNVVLKIDAPNPYQAATKFAYFASGYEVSTGFKCTFDEMHCVNPLIDPPIDPVSDIARLQDMLRSLRHEAGGDNESRSS